MMTKARTQLILLLTILNLSLVSATAQSSPALLPPTWEAKVAPAVLEAVANNGQAEFIAFFRQQADLTGADSIDGKAEKGRFVYERLAETASQSQAALLRRLLAMGVAHRAYWIANMIWVSGDSHALETVATHPDVALVFANTPRHFEAPVEMRAAQPNVPGGVETNIEHIGAPEVWALGYNGQGAVIGGQDTGYDWQHAALVNQYRGWNGGSANHNYNWHDAIHSEGGLCGADSPEPCDDDGHGTHTMGTMVGDDGAGNQIGVAPGARWIGCRNMDRGVGTPITYSECFQWFVAPTDSDGLNADPSMAPHVVNNSWACPPAEGCEERAILQAVVENVRAAGIMVVASAGNSGGAGCGTVQYPPAIYDATFSVGATDNQDNIALFSSRGPVTVDGSNRLKPDIVAPGVSVRSSIPGGHYGYSSGTSMAAPHVSGLVALLIAADPALAGEIDALEWALTASAVRRTSAEGCGGLDGAAIPNNTFGFGRIDAVRAIEQIQETIYRYFIPVSVAPAG